MIILTDKRQFKVAVLSKILIQKARNLYGGSALFGKLSFLTCSRHYFGNESRWEICTILLKTKCVEIKKKYFKMSVEEKNTKINCNLKM